MQRLITSAVPPATMYNRLPTLESAHAAVMRNGLIDIVVNDLGPIFVRHGVHGSWGIYLIHAHWGLNDGEIACEEVRQWDDGKREYALRPMEASERGYVPITFTLQDGVFQPLEFSKTPEGLAAHKVLMAKPEFLAELKQAMTANCLDGIFGLGLIRNSDPEHRWVEFTEDNERLSIQKFLRQADAPQDHLVQTSWAFAGQMPKSCRWNCGSCYSPEMGSHT